MSLRDALMRRIAQTGPISIADYMAECLFHPTLGYYTTREPFGRSGDFITAPETTQIFGELMGLCLAQAWIDQGQPAPFTFADLGPGRGTLMADMLRATRAVPGFLDAAQVVLVEASSRLRDIQKQTLDGTDVVFAEHVDALPNQPVFATANEFFDALPIRQFLRTETGWRERQVGLAEDALAFGLAAEAPQPALAARFDYTRAGDMVEVCDVAGTIAYSIGEKIANEGGAALIIDYGDWHSLGDTLQAVKEHAHVDPLEEPGTADLTAHVDFEALAQAAPCAHTRLTTQGVFLERLGFTPRAQKLANGLTGDALEELANAHRRLTHPAQMGNLFKVLGLFPNGKPPPPGLDV